MAGLVPAIHVCFPGGLKRRRGCPAQGRAWREASLGRAQRLIAVLLALNLPVGASAEDGREAASFPNRPIHIIVPFPAGGPSDLVARLIGQRMAEDWGQPVV